MLQRVNPSFFSTSWLQDKTATDFDACDWLLIVKNDKRLLRLTNLYFQLRKKLQLKKRFFRGERNLAVEN